MCKYWAIFAANNGLRYTVELNATNANTAKIEALHAFGSSLSYVGEVQDGKAVRTLYDKYA